MRVVQYCRVDSIGKRDLTNRSIRRMVNAYRRSCTCRSENRMSLAGLRKYLTLFDPTSGVGEKYLTLFLWLAPVLLCRFHRFVRFVEWWSENRISLAGLRKYFTLFSWHRPRFALSTRSIRSIRRTVSFYWRFVKWSCRSEKCISFERLRKYLAIGK